MTPTTTTSPTPTSTPPPAGRGTSRGGFVRTRARGRPRTPRRRAVMRFVGGGRRVASHWDKGGTPGTPVAGLRVSVQT
jgi:hypothetical protein